MMTRHSGDGGATSISTRGRRCCGAGLDQHGAPAAEQRHGVGFLDQPRRIGGELVALDAHEGEGSAGIVDRGLDQRVDALAHQPCVRPVHQHDRLRRIGPGDEAIDVGGFDGGHLLCHAREGEHPVVANGARSNRQARRLLGPRFRGDDSHCLTSPPRNTTPAASGCCRRSPWRRGSRRRASRARRRSAAPGRECRRTRARRSAPSTTFLPVVISVSV